MPKVTDLAEPSGHHHVAWIAPIVPNEREPVTVVREHVQGQDSADFPQALPAILTEPTHSKDLPSSFATELAEVLP